MKPTAIAAAAAKRKPPKFTPVGSYDNSFATPPPKVSGIGAQAQAELDPILAAITAAATQKAQNAEAAITGLTNSYANQIGGINYGAPYQNAEASQAAVDEALRSALSGAGSGLSASLASRLSALNGSSGAGAVQDVANQLGSQGVAAGNTRLASGSAALSNLIADAGAQNAYGTKMPGIVKLSGLQGVKQAEGNAQQEIASGTQSVESQLPGIIQQLRSDKLQAKALNASNAYKGAELGLSAQRIKVEAAHYQALDQHAQAMYGLSLGRLQLAQQKANQVRKVGGLSAYELSNIRAKAATALQNYYHGVAAKYEVGPNGARILVAGTGPGSAKTYQDAIKSLVLAYPALGPKTIVQMADKLYKPGEGGRPAKPVKQSAAANYINGLWNAILNPGKNGGGPSQTSPFAGKNLGSSDNAGGFLPKGIGFSYDRHDQGRDIQTRAGAPIIAPGDGYVVRNGYDPGGGGGHFGPSYPIVYFTSGPYKGRYVYIGHTVSAVRPGEKFTAGSVLSHTQQSGPLNGGAPSGWAEIGFAPGGTPGTVGQPAPF